MFSYVLTLKKGAGKIPEDLFTYEAGIGFKYGLHFRTEPLGLDRIRLILMSRRDGAPIFQPVKMPAELRKEIEDFFLIEEQQK